MARRSLLDLFYKLGNRGYDAMYRRGAPWESGPRPQLVELVEEGVLERGRAIDLGCGTGADSYFLADHGFEVTGVDFSPVAIDRARGRSEGRSVEPRFVVADLLDLPNDEIPGPFDLLFDGGTIDDLPPRLRPAAASAVTRLAAPGARFVMWCFYAPLASLPLMSFRGASRLGAPAIEPGEEEALFGDAWRIERLPTPAPGSRAACFLMRKR